MKDRAEPRVESAMRTLLAVVLLLVAGCGGGGGGSHRVEPTVVATPTATATPTPSGSPPPAGTLDQAFGDGGFTVTDFADRADTATAVTVQPDGKIVVVGQSDPGNGENAFALARYLPDGTLDRTFGDGGVVSTPPEPFFFADASAVAVAPDGAIVVGGTVSHLGISGASWRIARYDAAGRLDAGFGVGGIVTLLPAIVGSVAGVAVRPDGAIVVAGTTFTDRSTFAIVRLRHDGTADTDFGADGLLLVDIGEGATLSGFATDAVGALVVGGTAFGDDPRFSHRLSGFAVARVSPDGVLDADFGTGGIAVVDLHDAGFETLLGVTLMSDGAIVADGNRTHPPRPTAGGTLVLVRFQPDGRVDASYGVGGVVDVGIFVGASTATLVEPDGAVLVGDSTIEGGDGLARASLVRFTADGAGDPSFVPLAQHVRPGDDSAIRAMVATADGRLVVVGHSLAKSRGYDFAVGRVFLDAPR